MIQRLLPILILATAGPVSAQDVQFNRDVRPILSDLCFQCHGPDSAKRKAELRFDREESARTVIQAKHPDASELFIRLTNDDETKRMPPAKSGRKATPAQIATLKRWIEQGAVWEQHWAFIAPERPAIPYVRTPTHNPIDGFILKRLEQEKLAPSPEAGKTTLIRRVTLDLTGLPPTPAEVDAFLADTSANAYEKLVDRLLASPRFGERLAWRWIEAARYADTNGYQNDGDRIMWRWRDWVIDAINANMPFDQFTIEQLAGDLLPNPTLEQRIATGFNRNHRGNAEGGVIPEEYAVEYVVDRVDTTATVWLGLTFGCARCHDHKFDPFTQADFYRLFAYFNNVPEKGKAVKFGNSPPLIKAPTRDQSEKLMELARQLRKARDDFERMEPAIAETQRSWEDGAPQRLRHWFPERHLIAHFPLDAHEANSKPVRSENGETTYPPGRIDKAADFDGKRFLSAGDVAPFGFLDKFTISCWIYPRGTQGGAIVSRMTDVPQGDGYGIHLVDGRIQVNLVKRWLDDALRVESERKLEPDRWHHIAVVYDGTRVARGLRIFIDGVEDKKRVLLDDLNQSFDTKEPLRIGAGGGSRFHGLIDEVRIYDYTLDDLDVRMLADTEAISSIIGLPPDRRSEFQSNKLRAYFLHEHAPRTMRAAYQKLFELQEAKAAFEESIPTVMVMEEMPTPRDTHVLIRGEYDKKGAKVAPGVPAALPAIKVNGKNDRLALARWLVDPANPLTARVAVNRAWQMHFGTGLVKTVEDFGAQGEPPSHPELLDFLATEFVRSGWNVKALHRLIVTSATYRQSSRVTPDSLQRDPENRLLARGPRQRLAADGLRDQALFASGLLVEKFGGPSVKPYQPAGLWKELTGGVDYVADKGENLYRRGLYTYWKRTIAPPMLATFDAAGRESCVVRESRTNTPLQALALLNDVTFVEAARVLAQRVLKEETGDEARVRLGFRHVLGRVPSATELRILVDGLKHHRATFQRDPSAAKELLQVGDSPASPNCNPVELASFAAVMSVILNLDEALTKE